MNVSASRNNDQLLHWIAAALFLVGIVIVDTAIAAWIAPWLLCGNLPHLSLPAC